MELCKQVAVIALPGKGKGVVALERVARGEVIARWYPHDRRTIDRVYPSLSAFEAALARMSDAKRDEVLNHSWPTPEGRVAVGATGAIFGTINHSSPPTVLHEFGADVWTTTACVELNAGDELCYDYNLGSKYEVRTDAAMVRFLEVCDANGVQKRPSLGMTAPPCALQPAELADAKPLASLSSARKDGATDCTSWV